MEWTVVVSIALFILNGVLGVTMYLLKEAHNSLKEDTKNSQKAIDSIRETYFRKDDFREFKEELWRRLDKLEANKEK